MKICNQQHPIDTLTDQLDALPEEQWCSPIYQYFESIVRLGEAGRWERFESQLAELKCYIKDISQEYTQLTISAEEVTLEAAIGHLLLTQALGDWEEAMIQLEWAAELGESADGALELAEWASRCLALTQIFSSNIDTQVVPDRRAS